MTSLCSFFQKGQMSTIIHSLRGQMSTSLYKLGGKCSHMQFLGRGQMSEGANIRLLINTEQNRIEQKFY